MSTYIVGDIHGCFDEWIELKNRIESRDKQAKFILVGDIIDRGPKVIEMVHWAMQNITQDGKYQMMLGNHEDEKIQWWDYTCSVVLKRCTLKGQEINIDVLPSERYGFLAEFKKAGLNLSDLEKTINWFRTLPIYKDIQVNRKRFIVVHANLPFSAIDKNDESSIVKNLSESTISFMLWDREIGDFNKIKGTTLIHGHTPSIFPEAFPLVGDNKFKPEKLGKIVKCKNRFNIDCGLVYRDYYEHCNLAALRLEDFKEIYLYN